MACHSWHIFKLLILLTCNSEALQIQFDTHCSSKTVLFCVSLLSGHATSADPFTKLQ